MEKNSENSPQSSTSPNEQEKGFNRSPFFKPFFRFQKFNKSSTPFQNDTKKRKTLKTVETQKPLVHNDFRQNNERYFTHSKELITRRSKVQVLPPQPNKNPNFDTKRIEVRVLALCPKKARKQGFSPLSASVRLRFFCRQQVETLLFSSFFPAVFKRVIVERLVTVEFMGAIVELMGNRWIFGCNR